MKKEKTSEQLPDFLQTIKGKGEGFKIPDGYFEGLEDAVLARVRTAEGFGRPVMKVLKRPGFPLSIRPRTATLLAAALALVLVAVWYIRQPSPAVQDSPLAFTELTEDDIETYLLENLQEFEPEQLATLTKEETNEPTEETTPDTPKKNSHGFEEIHPDDLDNILDEMTDEELEQIL